MTKPDIHWNTALCSSPSPLTHGMVPSDITSHGDTEPAMRLCFWQGGSRWCIQSCFLLTVGAVSWNASCIGFLRCRQTYS